MALLQEKAHKWKLTGTVVILTGPAHAPPADFSCKALDVQQQDGKGCMCARNCKLFSIAVQDLVVKRGVDFFALRFTEPEQCGC